MLNSSGSAHVGIEVNKKADSLAKHYEVFKCEFPKKAFWRL